MERFCLMDIRFGSRHLTNLRADAALFALKGVEGDIRDIAVQIVSRDETSIEHDAAAFRAVGNARGLPPFRGAAEAANMCAPDSALPWRFIGAVGFKF